MKKTKVLAKSNLVEGVRVGNHSVKVFQEKNGKYLIVSKKYLLGIPIKTLNKIVDDYETAEDFMNDLRFEKRKIF